MRGRHHQLPPLGSGQKTTGRKLQGAGLSAPPFDTRGQHRPAERIPRPCPAAAGDWLSPAVSLVTVAALPLRTSRSPGAARVMGRCRPSAPSRCPGGGAAPAGRAGRWRPPGASAQHLWFHPGRGVPLPLQCSSFPHPALETHPAGAGRGCQSQGEGAAAPRRGPLPADPRASCGSGPRGRTCR